jgi:hypothetical protein
MAGIDVVNASADGANPLQVQRHSLRHPRDGRFVPRGSTQVRPLPQPSGPGGIDAVTGRHIPGENKAVLFRTNDPLDFERVHRVSPDYSSFVAISTQLDSGMYPQHLRRRV